MYANGYKVSSWGDKCVLKPVVVKAAQNCQYIKNHCSTVHFRILTYELYLSAVVILKKSYAMTNSYKMNADIGVNI